MFIIGASGHGKVIAEIAEENNIVIKAFVDSDQCKDKLLGYEVIHEHPMKPVTVVVAIGNNNVRKRIVMENPHYSYIALKHPRATFSKRSRIGNGSVMMAGATVNVNVEIGEHCIINTNASVDHDCIIANFVHLSPNVALAGNVTVGEGTHIGIGASVIQGITIGANCMIGAGTVVIRDVPDGVTMIGNPGRIIDKI